jgi:type II secretory ATPase GspE/PulE/Tfp pilus assembly ATPase PilB-like protein
MKLSKNRSIDFRVNTCPTLFGEKVVCRLLDPSSAQLGIDALGYEENQKKIYLENLAKPYGMILVTGPTGSGKTVSLYTGLNILNTADRNISTAEDPAEIMVPGINQVNVNPKVGLTFAAALRAFLRQDPDIIMVGEIRDLETAEIAIRPRKRATWCCRRCTRTTRRRRSRGSSTWVSNRTRSRARSASSSRSVSRASYAPTARSRWTSRPRRC